jgi:hypothetical protein
MILVHALCQSCAIVTHDVETEAGRDRCSWLMDEDDQYQIKASFQIVPEERYAVPSSFLEAIRARGFEINVHDLNHDGRLFSSREEFIRRAERINGYLQAFGARVSALSDTRTGMTPYRSTRHVHSERGTSGDPARRLLHGDAVFHWPNS